MMPNKLADDPPVLKHDPPGFLRGAATILDSNLAENHLAHNIIRQNSGGGGTRRRSRVRSVRGAEGALIV